MKRRMWPRVGRLLITLMVSFTVLVPLAMWGLPHVRRWQRIAQLTSTDLADRELALNYVSRRAGGDERVFQGAVEALEGADAAGFEQIVQALDFAGRWRREDVPREVWLRWTLRDLKSPEPGFRTMVAMALGEMREDAGGASVVSAMRVLMADPSGDVRYNAVVAAARLASVADAGAASAYRGMVREASGDAEPTVARHAWLFRGLLGEAWVGVGVGDRREEEGAGEGGDGLTPAASGSGGVSLGMLGDASIPPRVREAALWAAVRADPSPDAARLVSAVLRDATIDPTVRAMAAYTLSLLDRRGAAMDLYHNADFTAPAREAFTSPMSARDARLLQRLVLAYPPRAPGDEGPAEVLTRAAAPSQRGRLPRAVLEAAVHAAAGHMDEGEATRLLGLVEDDTLLHLAALEGLAVGRMDPTVAENAADIVRIAATAAAAHPDAAVLHPALGSREASIRLYAAVVAADRLEAEQAGKLTRDLLLSFNGAEIAGGMVLAGLTGFETDLLRKRHDIARAGSFELHQTARLALWMQDAGRAVPQNEAYTRGLCEGLAPLLASESFPTGVAVLALLHRRDPRGLDHLLGLTRDPPEDLVTVLRDQRFWPVLRRYLPTFSDKEPPPFWLWGDPELQRFQADVLRDWWVVQRR